MKWEDYDEINKTFTIKRSLSAGRVVASTKTGVEHTIPRHSLFVGIIKTMRAFPQGYMFRNPGARNKDGRYSNNALNRIWRKACKKTGETIDLYSGLKHSSCSQYVNEKGLSLSELQMITDHKKLDSVRRYADVQVARKRALMERGKIIPMRRVEDMDKQYLAWHNVKGIQYYMVTARSKSDACKKVKADRSAEQNDVIAVDFQITDVFLSTTRAQEDKIDLTLLQPTKSALVVEKTKGTGENRKQGDTD